MCANGCRVGLWIWAVRVYHHLSLPLPLQLRPLHWLSCSMHQLDAISRMFIFYQRRWVSVVWLMGSYLIFFVTCVRWLLIYVSWDRAFKRKCLISDILWKHNQKSPVSLFRESLLMCIIVYKPQIYMSVPMSQSSRYKPLWYHTWLSNSVLAAVLSTTLYCQLLFVHCSRYKLQQHVSLWSAPSLTSHFFYIGWMSFCEQWGIGRWKPLFSHLDMIIKIRGRQTAFQMSAIFPGHTFSDSCLYTGPVSRYSISTFITCSHLTHV